MGKTRNPEYIEKFGKHVRSLRDSKKLSRVRVSAQSGIEIMQIYRIEKGLVNATLSTLYALSKGLGVSPSELLDFRMKDYQ